VPLRPTLPTDDLYARLGVPRDASLEAIDLAWRGLLRRHHPDIAGPDALELAKRINVAHDWLSDPDLRGRYDRERLVGVRDGRPARGGAPATAGPPAAPRVHRRPPTVAEQVTAIVDRVGRLSADELDRLGLAEPAPIAFLATLRRFASLESQALLDDAQRAALAALPPAARRRPSIRDAVIGRIAETVLGDALDDLLGESGGIRARERLTRGWDAAVGQPRYGPATPAIEELLVRLATLGPEGIRALAATARGSLGPAPWPDSTSPDEDDALRVSSELASMDAAAAIAGPATSSVLGARRAAVRIAHLLVLRHAFGVAAFERAGARWIGSYIPRVGPGRPRVRRGA